MANPVDVDATLIDTRTEKTIRIPVRIPFGLTLGEYAPFGNLSRVGVVTADLNYGAHVRLIPTTGRVFPPDLLELWAQVTVRGEIGPHGAFVKWDQATWEKKRQQLASVPAPHADFPFPGYVATDKLHWLRAEFDEAKTDADKLRLALDLLRRCESAGDRIEAVRWRAEETRLSRKAAPPPRDGVNSHHFVVPAAAATKQPS